MPIVANQPPNDILAMTALGNKQTLTRPQCRVFCLWGNDIRYYS